MGKIAKISALFLGLVTATAALAQNQQNVGPGPQPIPGAANLTGTTLAANVVTSSLTTIGTLSSFALTNSGSNAGTSFTITNTNAGNVAGAEIDLANGTTIGSMAVLGTGYTTLGVLTANSMGISNGNNAGIYIMANGGSGTVRIAAGGTAASLTIANTAATLGTSVGLTFTTLPGADSATDSTMCVESATGIVTKAAGACAIASSMTFKNRIQPLPVGLDEVMRLKPDSFYYRKGYGDDGAAEQYGFLADDLATVLPKLVEFDKGQPVGIRMDRMIPVLTKAIQQQQAEIVRLRAANDNDEHTIKIIEARLDRLERAQRTRQTRN